MQTTDGWVMANLLSGTHVLRMEPEGTGTHLTIEITPPGVGRIPVIGRRFAERLAAAMARMHAPMDTEMTQLLERQRST